MGVRLPFPGTIYFAAGRGYSDIALQASYRAAAKGKTGRAGLSSTNADFGP